MASIASFPDHRESKPPQRVGLTTRQAWALEHIARCPSCGAWMLLTGAALRSATTAGYVPPAICEHYRAHE